MKTDLSELKKLVGANKLELALDKLSQLQINDPSKLETEVTHLRGRLKKLAQDRIKGVISPADDQLINNQIRTVLLQLITAYEKDESVPGSSIDHNTTPPSSAKNIVNIKKNYGDIHLS